MADQYAFIPREAISKFLLYCIDCQRKNSLEAGGGAANASTVRPAKISNQQVSEASIPQGVFWCWALRHLENVIAMKAVFFSRPDVGD